MRKNKTQKGITLVALIITIVVLLILAVVAIGAVKESGIIGHAKNAASGYQKEKSEEESLLSEYETLIDSKVTPKEGIIWAEFGEMLLYIGESNNLKVTSNTIQVEELNMSESGTPEPTGTIKEATFSNYTTIAFYFSTNIETIDFGNNLPNTITIDANNLNSLKEVKGLGNINALASNIDDADGGTGYFQNCTALERIEIPSTIQVLGKFQGCTSLNNIVIPENVTSIGTNAFQGCTSLTNITVNKAEGSLDFTNSGLTQEQIESINWVG